MTVLRMGLLGLTLPALVACAGDIQRGEEPGPGPVAPGPSGAGGGGGSGPARPGAGGGSGAAGGAAPAIPPGPGGVPGAGGAGGVFVGQEGDGNLQEHAAALTCTAAATGASPPRLWRLTALQYMNTLQALLPSVSKLPQMVFNPFEGSEAQERFANYASSHGMPELTFAQLLQASEVVAKQWTPLLARAFSCVNATAPDAACLRQLIEQTGAAAFRSPLSSEDAGAYEQLLAAERARLGTRGAVEMVLQAMLSSPRLVFRTELGDGKPDAKGRTRLAPHELAAALSYTVTDGPPDAELATAAAQGGLGSPEQLRLQARRLLGDGTARGSVLRFFHQFFRYEEVVDVFKDPALFKHHSAEALLADTDAFLLDLLANREGDFFPRMLTSSTVFASSASWESWSLTTRMSAKTPTKVTAPAGQRAGILTHPSVLVTYSHAEENDPIRRGKFIRESFLCGTVPAIPIEVVPALPELPNATLRERLKVHSEQGSCATCHKLMDPIGLVFEGYDHTGRHRTSEAARPADTRGEIVGVPGMDGALADPTALAGKLAASTLARECFVRHAFRYWLGRNESPADACTLRAAVDAFARSGDFIELVVTLLSSDSFVYRAATP